MSIIMVEEEMLQQGKTGMAAAAVVVMDKGFDIETMVSNNDSEIIVSNSDSEIMVTMQT